MTFEPSKSHQNSSAIRWTADHSLGTLLSKLTTGHDELVEGPPELSKNSHVAPYSEQAPACGTHEQTSHYPSPLRGGVVGFTNSGAGLILMAGKDTEWLAPHFDDWIPAFAGMTVLVN